MFKIVLLHLKIITVFLFLFKIKMNTSNKDKIKDNYLRDENSQNCIVSDDVDVILVVNSMNGSQIFCLGGLLSSPFYASLYYKWYHILTVTSCLDNNLIENIQIRLIGNPKNQILPKRYIRSVEKIIYHPSYNKINHLADIALITMDEGINLPAYPMILFNSNPLEKLKHNSFMYNILQWHYKTEFHSNTRYTLQNQTIYYPTKYLDCSPDNKSRDKKKADEYCYMFTCLNIHNSEQIDAIGAFLIHPLDLKGDINNDEADCSLHLTGLLSYSYMADNDKKILKFTVLYWYKTWIYSTIKTDIELIGKRKDNRAILSRAIKIQSNATTNETGGSDTTEDGILYYNDPGTQDEQWGDNPCSGVIVLNEHKKLLKIFIFMHGYYQFYF